MVREMARIRKIPDQVIDNVIASMSNIPFTPKTYQTLYKYSTAETNQPVDDIFFTTLNVGAK